MATVGVKFTVGRTAQFVILVLCHLLVESDSYGLVLDDNANLHHKLTLDPRIGYTLEWDIDKASNSIYFNVSAQTNGHLALTLSKNRGLQGSDLVICGIGVDGRPYVLDMNCGNHGVAHRDAKQDWRVVDAVRSGGRIIVTIARDLDTCDDQDVSITDGLIHVSWSHGSSNNIPTETRFVSKGNVPVYFQDPVPNPSNSKPQDSKPWRVARKFAIPARHSSYWCSVVRGPQLSKKHQIVEFRPYLQDELARKHVHHQLLYRCSTPPGLDPATLFEPFANQAGEECYLNDNPTLPTAFCRELIHMWAVGGVGSELPETVGFPVEPNEYFLFEAHYDNPEIRSDLTVENGVDFTLTSELRPNDGGMMFIGYGVFGAFVIPPQSSNFHIAGHCSSQCTREILPSSGIDIIGGTMHGHTNTRRMRLKQFRGDKELPWILNDDSYDFNVQQARFLSKPVTVLPGDQVTTECVFENTFKNGSTVTGFSTRDEMCMSFLYLKNRIPYLYCTSEFPTEITMARFGIRNATWEVVSHERIVTEAVSRNLIGQQFSRVVDSYNWTPARKSDVEREQMYGQHVGSCPNLENMGQLALQVILARRAGTEVAVENNRPTTQTISTPFPSSTVQYPGVPPYSPPQSCQQDPIPQLPWGTPSSQLGGSLVGYNFGWVWGDARTHPNIRFFK